MTIFTTSALTHEFCASDIIDSWSNIKIQGNHNGLTLDFVDFNSGIPPVCPFAMPSLPNFHLLKQNWSY